MDIVGLLCGSLTFLLTHHFLELRKMDRESYKRYQSRAAQDKRFPLSYSDWKKAGRPV